MCERQATVRAKLTWPFQCPLGIARRLQDTCIYRTLFGKGWRFSNAVALKCSEHQKCTKGILKHRGHFWGPGTLFLKSAMTLPIGDITQWWPSGSLPHKSPSREALLRSQERLHTHISFLQTARSKRPSDLLAGPILGVWRNVPGWSGTAMASYMRSDSGTLHGPTSPEKQCCRSHT